MDASRPDFSRSRTLFGALPHVKQTDIENRRRSSLSVPKVIRAVSDSFRRKRKSVVSAESDGSDSDATLDLDEGLAIPMLQGTPPLQRMASEYERQILRSLAQGKTYAYACARCHDEDRKKESLLWRSSDSDLAVTGGGGPGTNGKNSNPSLVGQDDASAREDSQISVSDH